jgi:hypothetical protein
MSNQSCNLNKWRMFRRRFPGAACIEGCFWTRFQLRAAGVWFCGNCSAGSYSESSGGLSARLPHVISGISIVKYRLGLRLASLQYPVFSSADRRVTHGSDGRQLCWLYPAHPLSHAPSPWCHCRGVEVRSMLQRNILPRR